MNDDELVVFIRGGRSFYFTPMFGAWLRDQEIEMILNFIEQIPLDKGTENNPLPSFSEAFSWAQSAEGAPYWVSWQGKFRKHEDAELKARNSDPLRFKEVI